MALQLKHVETIASPFDSALARLLNRRTQTKGSKESRAAASKSRRATRDRGSLSLEYGIASTAEMNGRARGKVSTAKAQMIPGVVEALIATETACTLHAQC